MVGHNDVIRIAVVPPKLDKTKYGIPPYSGLLSISVLHPSGPMCYVEHRQGLAKCPPNILLALKT